MPNLAVNGIDLAYEIAGNGEPIVLVHGSSVDRTSWDPVVRDLASGFRVLTYDRRGHGKSGSATDGVSIDKDVSDVAALLYPDAYKPLPAATMSATAAATAAK